MDLRKQAIERILALDEDDLQKVMVYLEENQESSSGSVELNQEASQSYQEPPPA